MVARDGALPERLQVDFAGPLDNLGARSSLFRIDLGGVHRCATSFVRGCQANLGNSNHRTWNHVIGRRTNRTDSDLKFDDQIVPSSTKSIVLHENRGEISHIERLGNRITFLVSRTFSVDTDSLRFRLALCA